MDDFNYKKYSLENLEKWVEDAVSSSEASPQEIYDTIQKVVSENYYHHKYHASRAYELMEKLNGADSFSLSEVLKEREYYEFDTSLDDINASPKVCDKDDKSPECQNAWNDFWEENNYPEEHSQYTEEELDAMCNKAASDDEKEKCREYNLREAEYYDKRIKLDSEYTQAKIQANSPYNDGWTREYYQKIVDKYEGKQDKVKKWILPVELDGLTGECYINLPDDLLEVANLKEGDQVEWIDLGGGSFEMRKVNGIK